MTNKQIRGIIVRELKNAKINYYHRTADENAAYPYVVYKLTKLQDYDTAQKQYAVDFDIWGLAKNNKAEDISEQLMNLFDRRTLRNGSLAVRLYFDGADWADEPDVKLEHKLVTFEVRAIDDIVGGDIFG